MQAQLQLKIADDYEIDYLPEHELIFAIIQRALNDLVGEAVRDANLWLRSESQEPWSFLWCCEQIDLQPEIVAQVAKKITSGYQPKRYQRKRGTRHSRLYYDKQVRLEQLKKLHEAGYSVPEIAQKTKHSKEYVYKHLKSQGLSGRRYNREWVKSYIEEGYTTKQIAYSVLKASNQWSVAVIVRALNRSISA